jgi:undecaprenol kinase
MKWVSKGKKKKYSFHRFFKSFGYATSGIITTCKTEQSFLFEIVYGIITIILGILLKLSLIEISIVLLAIALVLSMELINTSIEYTVDMAMPEIHPLAKQAKDIASGAVLVCSIIAFIIGIIIYLPKVINLF